MPGSKKNKHGLARNIPDPIKREVRQRCGFGCVVCGSAIYDYEHFDPEFKDATQHSASGIALLCPTHHKKKERGLLSLEEYERAIQNPHAMTHGYAFTDWSTADFAPQILIGSFTFTGGTSVLQIGDELLLGFNPPEEPGSPPQILFRVFDSKGVEAFGIIGNEIRCHNEAFDIEAVGTYWRIRSKPYMIDIVVRFDPPTRITFERLRFRYLKWELTAVIGSFQLLYDRKPVTVFGGCARISGPCLFTLDKDRPHVSMTDMTIEGGAGPVPIGTRPSDSGFQLSWPLYGLMNPSTELLRVVEYRGNKILEIYTLKSLAREAWKDGFQITPINKNQLCLFVEEYGEQGLIDCVSFNPSKKMVGYYHWADFLQNMSSEGDVSVPHLSDDDPLIETIDRGPITFRYPLYIIVGGDLKAKVHEVEIPTINVGVDILPIFTTEEQANAALKKLTGDFRVQGLGQPGLLKVLKHVVLPKKIYKFMFNPDLDNDEGIHQYYEIEPLIPDLERTFTDEEIQEVIARGDATNI